MATIFSFPSPWVIDILGKLDLDFVFIDFAQSLGYPATRSSGGHQGHRPSPVASTRPDARCSRTSCGTWISDMLLDAGRRSLSP